MNEIESLDMSRHLWSLWSLCKGLSGGCLEQCLGLRSLRPGAQEAVDGRLRSSLQWHQVGLGVGLRSSFRLETDALRGFWVPGGSGNRSAKVADIEIRYFLGPGGHSEPKTGLEGPKHGEVRGSDGIIW